MRICQVVNQSKTITRKMLEDATKALQIQFERDFSPAWGVNLALAMVQVYDPTREGILILDDATQADALGYHALVAHTSVPVGFVFAAASERDGTPWTVPYSHEAHEQAVDPFCGAAWIGMWDGKPAAIALETDDPVEQVTYDVTGVELSNFVLPAWFDYELSDATKWDFLGTCTGPCEVRPFGCMSVSYNLHTWMMAEHASRPRSAYRSAPEHWLYSRSMRRRRRATP